VQHVERFAGGHAAHSAAAGFADALVLGAVDSNPLSRFTIEFGHRRLDI
jgi:hypothetical protein